MKTTFLFWSAFALSITLQAQPSLAKLNAHLKTAGLQKAYVLQLASPTQGTLQFNSAVNMKAREANTWLQSALGFRKGKDSLQKRMESTGKGFTVERYQQLYGGIKIEHGVVNVVSRAGRVASVQMEVYPLAESLTLEPKLTENEALAKAIAYVGAIKYSWDDQNGTSIYKKPSGELVIVEDFFGKRGRLNLAYKFDIYAERPLSRSYVYINAINGSVLLVDRIIRHTNPAIDGHGPTFQTEAVHLNESFREEQETFFTNTNAAAQTRYSGTQAIVADDGGTDPGKPYRLRQTRNGHDIITLNYQRLAQSNSNDAAAIDFADDDNNWTTAEHKPNYDNGALDVQHAMQLVSDYWKVIHGRNSWDNAGTEMRSYVHVRSGSAPTAGYDNAYWSGAAMYYGDGSYYAADGSGTVVNVNGFKPLTTIDISAHELGHAVCQSTAQLVYQRESGAMNEAFSDIWAACVENYSGLPKSPFLIGEEVAPPTYGGALRSMSNPKLYGNPDTYGGQYWTRTSLSSCTSPTGANDQCGVHNNSGLLNKWFYLITQGGTGTNDNADSYNVSGLGFAKSEQIAFLTELSLTPNADYAAARLASINAATTLYGNCSNEVMQVTNAWFAVGVGTTANCTPTVEFLKSEAAVVEGEGLAGTCNSTKTVSVAVKLGSIATQKTDVQFNFSGSAVQGVNYTVASPTVSFYAGESGTKNLDITILDNGTIEGSKTILISYTVNANGGNATAGLNNQTYKLTITDDDVIPLPIKSGVVKDTVLLSENFETATPGTIFPTGWNATLAYTGGNSATNLWSLGSNAGAGLTGNAAYISNTASTTLDYAYTTTSKTDRVLRLPVLNTTGLRNIQLQFRYKVGGEAYAIDPANPDPSYNASLWDYARVMYDAGGTGLSFSTLFNTSSNDYFGLYGDGSTPGTFGPFTLPASMENKSAVYLGFRWINDAADGNGLPLAVDDIQVTGHTIGTSIACTAGQTNSVRLLAGNMDTYIASNGGINLLAKISASSQTLSSLTASLVQTGSGNVTINTGSGSFFRTQKIIQLTPAVANTSITYKATFYFTVADVSGWSPAEIPALKILKVKDGVDLNGTLTSADAELVTPTFSDNSSNGYYAYTGNFTGFSRFMLVSPTFVLPVNLLTFDAVPKKNSIELSWATAAETTNKGFAIERSADGKDFSSIGWVDGMGISNRTANYRFTDNYVQVNTAYQYRLKQVDQDNRFYYSVVRQAHISDDGIAVSVSPNPATSRLKVFVGGEPKPMSISLVNAKGQRVAHWKNTGVAYEADISRFGKGVYTVVVHLPGGDKTSLVIFQ